MSLSRLQNLYRNLRGRTIYVDQNSLDATDSVENTGTSPLRPFLTIQRALIEVVRFSYQAGRNNDRFGATTVKVAAGVYEIDNRPGYIFKEDGTFLKRSGETTTDLLPFDLNTNFDLTSSENQLYKLNSIHSGVILPRGVSLIGDDYRKCIIRPKYVPNPSNDNIETGAIFRLTGANYVTQFTFFDADPNNNVFKDYTSNIFVPSFSHHKLRVFEYADGVNSINISDDFVTYKTLRTDLEMYYQKVALVYGESSSRPINPDYPNIVDIEPISEEYNIVGAIGSQVGITSIRAGDGATSTNVVTVTTESDFVDINVDSPIRITGVNSPGYDGQFVVYQVLADNQLQYRTQNPPINPNPSSVGATLSVVVDTVNSASPYISNCALRSVYGMCGILADGNKADGFKSIVVERFTGISLQKDSSAFIKYDVSTGTYVDSTTLANLESDSRAKYRPDYQNFHCKVDNDAFMQLVSVFCIGYSDQIVASNGGDFSVTNSNSTFGARALVSTGYKDTAFQRDNQGYVTHIISPKEIESSEITVEFLSIDVQKTVGIASTNRLYLYNETNVDVPPNHILDGYRLGAKRNDELNVVISENNLTSQYSARIIMPNTQFTSEEISSEKSFYVGRNSVGINSISSNVFTLTNNHSLVTGETVRLFSDNGHLPDGITNNQVYYAITNPTDISLGANQIKIAQTLNDANNNIPIIVNQKGGIINIVSRVSDKKPGDIGHPIQFDQQWYVNVATASSENSIYSKIVGLGTTGLGEASPRTFITRTPNTNSSEDTIYKLRYVIPKSAPITARPPIEGYIIQETNTSIGSTDTETAKFLNPSTTILSNSTELRKINVIAGASWSSGSANFITEVPHNLSVGSVVEIQNVTSTNNPIGVANSDYNVTAPVSGITSSKHFSVPITLDPGTFINNVSVRNNSLPVFKRKDYSNIYYLYKVKENRPYIQNTQDGVYELTIINASNSPTISPYTEEKFLQPIQNLYPQVDRDNPNSDPNPAQSFAVPDIIGQVVVDTPQNSITKETIQKVFLDQNIGIGLTNIVSSTGLAHTLYTKIDHGLSGISTVSIISSGSGYVDGTYYNASLVGFAGSTTGQFATVVVTVNSGSVNGIKIIDGGSAYGVGNTLSVIGVGTTGSGAVVRVESIKNNVNDTLSIFGAEQYNNLYRITQIVTGRPKEIIVQSSELINNFSTTGVGQTFTQNSSAVLTGKSIGVSTISYDSVTGIATVGFTTSHGFFVGNKFRLSGSTNTLFNKDFIVEKVLSNTTFITNTGISTNLQPTGTLTVYQNGLTSTGEKNRLIANYAGITTTLIQQIQNTDFDTTPLVISNAESLGLDVGDYLSINNEIVRISRTVSGNNVFVFRGVCGTEKQTHSAGSVVRKIKIIPVELRRSSIIKATNHTFEYVGYGPGNYSTALPQNQDRVLSAKEEILAQTTKQSGGSISFTATNSDGRSYNGTKKVNTITGEETTYDTPFSTVVGEDPNTNTDIVGSSVITTGDIIATRTLKVNGGSENDIISQFDGPVVFTSKLTSNSNLGIEANSYYIQGEEKVSRKVTISNDKPIIAGNYGDISFNSEPSKYEFVGWSYVKENKWEPFGFIGGQGVGIASAGNYVGFSTLLDIVTEGIVFNVDYDTITGVSTLTFDANPRVAITTGANAQNLVGLVTTINFVGALVNVSGSPSGIATVDISPVSLGGSLPGLPYNSLQFNDNGKFSGVSNSYYDEVNNILHFGSYPTQANTLTITNDGRLGFSTYLPTSKIEIIADNETSLYIKSTSGTNIVRIDNTTNDTTPFIIDANGNVGVHTANTIAELDVVGNVAVTGSIRIYESDRTNYIGLSVTSFGSDLNFTLPSSYGSVNQVLTDNGSGVLTWSNVSRQNVEAGNGISLTNVTSGGITTSTISNIGVTRVIAGTGVTISPSDGTGNITISANTGSSAPYPFTTRGFSMVL